MSFFTTKDYKMYAAPRGLNDVERALSLLPKDGDVDESVLAEAFLNSPYASFILDWSGRILVCNRRAERIFCPPDMEKPEAMRGLHLSALTNMSAAELKKLLRECAAKGSIAVPIQKSAQVQTRATTLFQMSLLRSASRKERLIVLTQDQLEATALALTKTNTQRKELKSKLEQVEATNANLLQSLFSMEAFAQAAGHDLRTPLNTLSGLIEMFDSTFADELPEKAQEFLRHMSRATQQLDEFTTELLDHARSAAAPIVAEKISLGDYVTDVCRSFKPDAQKIGATIKVTGQNFDIMAEPAMFRILLINLISNAMKFRSAVRKPVIEIKMILQPGRRALRVSDNGVGFDPAHKAAVFRPFHRLNNDVEGSGIGLSTCQEVCRRHSWNIDCTANVDQGASFTVTF